MKWWIVVVAVSLLIGGCGGMPANSYTVSSGWSQNGLTPSVTKNLWGNYTPVTQADVASAGYCTPNEAWEWLWISTKQANTFMIQSILSGKCLEIGIGSSNGAPAYQAKCTGNDNQKWLILPLQPGSPIDKGIVMIQSVDTHKCLQTDVASLGNLLEYPIVQGDCSSLIFW